LKKTNIFVGASYQPLKIFSPRPQIYCDGINLYILVVAVVVESIAGVMIVIIGV
jgi:hypothetical protein